MDDALVSDFSVLTVGLVKFRKPCSKVKLSFVVVFHSFVSIVVKYLILYGHFKLCIWLLWSLSQHIIHVKIWLIGYSLQPYWNSLLFTTKLYCFSYDIDQRMKTILPKQKLIYRKITLTRGNYVSRYSWSTYAVDFNFSISPMLELVTQYQHMIICYYTTFVTYTHQHILMCYSVNT